jgi:hypothetical protein
LHVRCPCRWGISHSLVRESTSSHAGGTQRSIQHSAADAEDGGGVVVGGGRVNDELGAARQVDAFG